MELKRLRLNIKMKNKNLLLLISLMFLVNIPVFAQEVVFGYKEKPKEIEVIIKEFFKNDPIMIHIAKCESTFRQYYDSGKPFRGSGIYIGIFQIDENIHTQAAMDLGFDIYTTAGNIGYANHIYQREGSRPWYNCAKTYLPDTAPDVEVVDLDTLTVDTNSQITSILGSGLCPEELRLIQNLRVSDRDGRFSTYQKGEVTEVALLQSHINRILKSHYNEASGPVDGIFGKLTKRGVERLQIALNEVLNPAKPLVIDGVVGPYTRSAINNSCGYNL